MAAMHAAREESGFCPSRAIAPVSKTHTRRRSQKPTTHGTLTTRYPELPARLIYRILLLTDRIYQRLNRISAPASACYVRRRHMHNGRGRLLSPKPKKNFLCDSASCCCSSPPLLSLQRVSLIQQHLMLMQKALIFRSKRSISVTQVFFPSSWGDVRMTLK